MVEKTKKKSHKVSILLIIIAIILVGMLIYVYQITTVAQNLRARIVLNNFDIKTTAGVIPNSILIDLRVYIDNPTKYDFEARRIHLEIYVEDQYLTSIDKNDIYIPSDETKPVDFNLEIKSTDVLNIAKEIIKELISKGDRRIKYEIKGRIEIPIKLFGIIPIFDIDMPINISDYYTLPIPLTGSEVSRANIHAYWERLEACVGDTVYAEVSIKGPINGYVNILIMKDEVLRPDTVIMKRPLGYMRLGEHDTKTIDISFIPSEASSSSMRGYYIAVEVNNSIVWKQESSYPPRLKVYECSATSITTTEIPTYPVYVQSIQWYVNGYRSDEAKYGDNVECFIVLSTDRSQVSGYLTIEIMKDRRALPDETVLRKSYYVVINRDSPVTISVSFTVTDKSTLTIRGYYVKVYFNNKKIYEMPNGYPPRLRLVSS